MVKLALASPVWAQITNPALPGFEPDQGGEIVGGMVSTIISVLLVIGVLACLLYLIVGAFRWISAKGDKNYLQEARDMIFNALVGLMILFAIFAILRLFGSLFGLNLLDIEIPTIIPTENGGSGLPGHPSGYPGTPQPF